jgi:hypothetical protein
MLANVGELQSFKRLLELLFWFELLIDEVDWLFAEWYVGVLALCF